MTWGRRRRPGRRRRGPGEAAWEAFGVALDAFGGLIAKGVRALWP